MLVILTFQTNSNIVLCQHLYFPLFLTLRCRCMYFLLPWWMELLLRKHLVLTEVSELWILEPGKADSCLPCPQQTIKSSSPGFFSSEEPLNCDLK